MLLFIAFQNDTGMKQITQFQTTVTLEVGEQCFYKSDVQGSVGYDWKAVSSNTTIVRPDTTHVDYKNPDYLELSGGDEATQIIYFSARKKGSAVITVTKTYRGKTAEEFTIGITVE